MFNLSTFAEQYDRLAAAGVEPPGFALCDKRFLLPLDQLPAHVGTDDGVALAPARVASLIEAGWIPALPMEGSGELGFPMYVPSRVALYLRLERDGWTPAELAAAAEAEEALIDHVLTSPDTPYEDDDLAIVRIGIDDEITGLRLELSRLEHPGDELAGGPSPETLETPETQAVPSRHTAADVRARLAHAERTAAFFASRTLDTLAPGTRAKVARHAYLLRAHFEQVRVWMLMEDRAVLEAGYSFFVDHTRVAWEPEATPAWTFERIDWASTLRRQAAVSADDAPLPVRLPGLVLDGERVTLGPRTTPAQYEALWRTYDLDTYLALLAERAGARVCVRCLAALPDGSRASRRFCSDACRGVEKAEGYRRRHPDRVKQSQHRWRSS